MREAANHAGDHAESSGRKGLERGLPKLDMYAPGFRERRRQADDYARAVIAAAEADAVAIVEAASRDPRQIASAALRLDGEQPTSHPSSHPAPPPPRRPVALIISMTAMRHGLDAADLTGISRARHVVAARHEAMLRVRIERPDLSLPQLGRHFGGRDHTTVINALRKGGYGRPRGAKAGARA